MRRVVTLATLIGLLLAVLFVGNGFGLFDSSHPLSQTSVISAAPQPTATYISELGPAVMLPPQHVGELPSSGAGIGAATPWPKTAGLALALVATLLIHAALTLRPKDG